MSFEFLRVEKIEPYEYKDDGRKRNAEIVHVKVRFKRKRTIKEWLDGEKPKVWEDTVQYFTTTGHTWKDYPSLRSTDVMEWSQLREMYEQYKIKKTLKKSE